MKRFALALVVVCACGGGGGEPATAIFELPREGTPTADYYALPFPNDLRVRADGTLDLDQLPRDNQILTEYFAIFSAQFEGFGESSAAYFRFDAPINLKTLPRVPQDSVTDRASVYLVDVDPDSPHRGERTPLRFRFDENAQTTIGPDWLACLPYPGFPLRPLTTYAVVITRRLHATDGSAVARSPDWQALVGPDDPQHPPDAAVLHAREVYAPLLDWLDEAGGDDRADVQAAAVFTTGDPTSMLGKMREVIRARPAPVLSDMKVEISNASVTFMSGTYQGPIFQAGEVPYTNEGGGIEVGEDGLPIVQREDPIRVGMSFPGSGEPPAAGWPVVIYAHGTGGDYKSFFDEGIGFRFAQQGFAVVGIDQNLNGERIPSSTTADYAFYNFVNPVAGRDNSRQGGADHFALLYLLESAEVRQKVSESYTRRHHFDMSRVYYFGHSQGAITGPLFLAYEPRVRAAILSGAGGLLYWALLQKKEPVDVGALLGNLVRDFPLDEFDNVLALIQMYIEPADPINYARLMTLEPPPGCGPKDVFQSEGFTDHYTPIPNIEALGVALGSQLVEPVLHPVEGMEVAGRPPVPPPVTGNVADGHTSVLLQYDQEPDSDGHFVIFDIKNARVQSLDFLLSSDADGRATLTAP